MEIKEIKSYLFCFILESAVVRSETEVVLRCENDVQFDALTVVDLCGLPRVSLLESRAGRYYLLAFHRWLLIY